MENKTIEELRAERVKKITIRVKQIERFNRILIKLLEAGKLTPTMAVRVYVRSCQVAAEAHLIATAPIPNFPPGGTTGGQAIVGDTGPEMVIIGADGFLTNGQANQRPKPNYFK